MSDFRKEGFPKAKSVMMKILSAYEHGVSSVSDGVEYTVFGRDRELLDYVRILTSTANQSGQMVAYIGPYGVGKSFIMSMFQALAVKKEFVVMSAEITRDNWFAGTHTEKQGLNLYRELIKNTAIKGKISDAFDTILEKWYYQLEEGTNGSLEAIYHKFDEATNDCKSLTMYDDIRGAIFTRFREIKNNEAHSEAMNFFLANITRKSDAAKVGAKDYIHDSKWFSILNTFSHLFVKAGYRGLIVQFDQVDYLLNLQKTARHLNYESLLTMMNAVNGGRTEYLSVFMFAAESLVDNETRGTSSYTALHQRLGNAHRLPTLPPEETVGLLRRLKDIHERAFDWESGITDEEIAKFVEDMINSMPNKANCVRPISMAWIKKLNDLQIGKGDDQTYVEIVKCESSKTEEIQVIPDEFPDE